MGRAAEGERGQSGAVVIGYQLNRKRLASKTEFNGYRRIANPHQNCADMRHSSKAVNFGLSLSLPELGPFSLHGVQQVNDGIPAPWR